MWQGVSGSVSRYHWLEADWDRPIRGCNRDLVLSWSTLVEKVSPVLGKIHERYWERMQDRNQARVNGVGQWTSRSSLRWRQWMMESLGEIWSHLILHVDVHFCGLQDSLVYDDFPQERSNLCYQEGLKRQSHSQVVLGHHSLIVAL